MSKIVKIGDECVGCGTCVELCPSIFSFDEDNLKAKVTENDLVSEDQVEEAMQACPVQCISLRELHCNRCETCSILCTDVCENNESEEMVEVMLPEGSPEDCLESAYENCDEECIGCDRKLS